MACDGLHELNMMVSRTSTIYSYYIFDHMMHNQLIHFRNIPTKLAQHDEEETTRNIRNLTYQTIGLHSMVKFLKLICAEHFSLAALVSFECDSGYDK